MKNPRVVLNLLGMVLGLSAASCPAAILVNLGDAGSFGVLAGSGVTIAAGATSVVGDVGTYPTDTVTGLPNLTLDGTLHLADFAAQEARLDLISAFAEAGSQVPTLTYPAASDLGGLTLTPGVYKNPTSFGLTGTLTLDGLGDPNAVWVFLVGSTLTTASDSSVLLTGGAHPGNIFWQVGSSATLGTDTDFSGTIMAQESISLVTGAEVQGRLLAIDGAVTLQSNTITVAIVPEPACGLLVLAGGVLGLRRRRSSTLKSRDVLEATASARG